MSHKTPEALQFEHELMSRIDNLRAKNKAVADANPGKSIMLSRAGAGLEGYRHRNLSSPEVLVNLLHSIKMLPPELLTQAVEQCMKLVLERLKATAQVDFDSTTRELKLANYPIATLEEKHARMLAYLLTLPRGTVVTNEELIAAMFDPETSPYKNKDAQKLLVYNDVVHTLATLDNLLKGLNITEGMEGFSAAYPLRVVDYRIIRREKGLADTVWNYTVWSDFVLPAPETATAEETTSAELNIDFNTGLLNIDGKDLFRLEPEEREILSLLLDTGLGNAVRVEEIATQLQEELPITWTRLGRLEEMLQEASQKMGGKNILSLNLAATPLKNKEQHLTPHVVLSSAFSITWTN